jgi:hypothetical protein
MARAMNDIGSRNPAKTPEGAIDSKLRIEGRLERLDGNVGESWARLLQ